MTPIVEIPLPDPEAIFTSFDFSIDARSVLLGTNLLDERRLGVTWIDWAATRIASRTLALPHTEVGGHDATACPVDVDGDRVVVSTRSALWLLSRTERVGPTKLCDAPDGRLAWFRSANHREVLMWNGKTLEHLALDSGERRGAPLALPADVRSIAINAQRTHIAFTTPEALVCRTLGGKSVGTWAVAGGLGALRFADDDLALWGIARDAVIQCPMGGEPVRWTVPGRALVTAEPGVALFGGPEAYCTLDLSTGTVTEVGTVTGQVFAIAWRPAHRRCATLDVRPEPVLRVFGY